MSVRQIRLFLRETPFLRKTVYRFIFKMMELLKWKQHLLHKHGPKAIGLIMEAAKKLGVPCMADYGTLLGIIRDGDFIAHDADMDFCILPGFEDIKLFFFELERKGFYFEWMQLFDGVLTELTVRYKEVRVDFFFPGLTRDKKNLFFIQHDSEFRRYEFPMIHQLEAYPFKGGWVSVPKNYAEYLHSLYGNWKIVVKNWHSSMAPAFKGVLKDSRYHVETSRSRECLMSYLEENSTSARLVDGC